MKQLIRDYFSFNRRERNGIFVLLCILILLIGYLSFSKYLVPEKAEDFSEFEAQVNRFELEREKFHDSVKLAEENRLEERSAWAKAPRTFADKYPSRKYPQNFFTFPKPAILELNTADSASLVELKGIGPAFARRIIRFRESLGGFVAVDQLREVYGMDSVLFSLVVTQVKLDITAVRKININTASETELCAHPYLGRKAGSALFHYRKNHGNFSDVAGIKSLDLVNAELYTKLAPYLSAE